VNRKPAAAILVIFFVSGMTSLLYQIVWLRQLGFVFGNTVHAAATLIAVFLAGLGLGAWLFGRHLRAFPPLLLYAALEVIIGLYGAFSHAGFGLLDDLYIQLYRSLAGGPYEIALARVAASALFLLPPTILMGGTLPILVRWFSSIQRGSGKAVSSLYAANTFGATAGVALAGFFLIPFVGVIATTLTAVLLNFALAIASVVAHRAFRASVDPPKPARWVFVPIPLLLLASFLMGLSSIADEVFWSRILVLHLGSSVYAYSMMLFCFLIGLAIGSSLIYLFIHRVDPVKTFALLQISLAVLLALQVHYLTLLSDVIVGLATWIDATTHISFLAVLTTSVFTALGPPTIIMGASFPLMVRLYGEAGGITESESTGVVYFFNTVGSIFGSFLAGFVLIPWIGSQNGLFLMAAINLLVGSGFLVWAVRKGSGRRALAAAFGGGLLVVGLAFATATPGGVILSAGTYAGERNLLFIREDVSATVALRQWPTGALSLELNGVNVAGSSPSLIGTQKLQGHLPLMMHPDPKKILHIGFGSGGTAYSVSLHPSVEEIVVAEISSEVLEASDQYLRSINHGILDDPRVRVEINDGRNFVLATPEKFDVLLSDSIHPRYAGNGSLYTLDYFELCRSVLNPGGVISMWLPTYSLTSENYRMILSAFQRVFPNTTVWYVPNNPNEYTIVIGRMEKGPIPFDRLESRMEGAVLEDLREIAIEDAYTLSISMIIDPVGVEELTRLTPPHLDDLPAVEYESGRVLHRDLSWLQNFRMLLQHVTPLPRNLAGVSDLERLANADRRRHELLRRHHDLITRRVAEGGAGTARGDRMRE
jgi:spermidine synthase